MEGIIIGIRKYQSSLYQIMEETPNRDNKFKAHQNSQNRINAKAKPHTKETQVFKEVANP